MNDLRADDPDHIGPYRITGFLGEGGQGVVYKGVSEDGRPVAIKVLHTRRASDAKARARFLRELESARAVARFCTAQVLDGAVDSSQPYIVSEFVDGPSLRAVVKKEGPLDPSTLERLAIGTATALSAIHRAGIVHRDLNPSNVLLGPDGPRVVDFGLSKAIESALESTERLGTPAYMAPEQFTSEIGPAGDIFSWAGTIIFAATGASPFGTASLGVIMHRIMYEEVDLTPLPESLRPAVAAAFAKDPADRPNADALLRTLLGQERTADDPIPEPAPVPPPGEPSRRRMLLLTGTGALALAGAGTATAVLTRGKKEKKSPFFTLHREGELKTDAEQIASIAIGDLRGTPIVVSGNGREDRVRVWDLKTRQELPYDFKHDDWVGSVGFLQVNGTPTVAAGGGDHFVRIWDLSSGRQRGKVSFGEGIIEGISCIRVGTRDVLAFSPGGTVSLYDLATLKKIEDLPHPNTWVHCIVAGQGRNGPLLLSGDHDGQVHIWDLNDGSELNTVGGIRGIVNSVTMGTFGDRTLGLGGGEEGTVWLWDVDAGQQLGQLPRHSVKVKDVAFGSVGGRDYAASCSEDGSVHLTDLATLTPLAPSFTEPGRGITALATAGDLLLAGDSTGWITYWRLKPTDG